MILRKKYKLPFSIQSATAVLVFLLFFSLASCGKNASRKTISTETETKVIEMEEKKNTAKLKILEEQRRLEELAKNQQIQQEVERAEKARIEAERKRKEAEKSAKEDMFKELTDEEKKMLFESEGKGDLEEIKAGEGGSGKTDKLEELDEVEEFDSESHIKVTLARSGTITPLAAKTNLEFEKWTKIIQPTTYFIGIGHDEASGQLSLWYQSDPGSPFVDLLNETLSVTKILPISPKNIEPFIKSTDNDKRIALRQKYEELRDEKYIKILGSPLFTIDSFIQSHAAYYLDYYDFYIENLYTENKNLRQLEHLFSRDIPNLHANDALLRKNQLFRYLHYFDVQNYEVSLPAYIACLEENIVSFGEEPGALMAYPNENVDFVYALAYSTIFGNCPACATDVRQLNHWILQKYRDDIAPSFAKKQLKALNTQPILLEFIEKFNPSEDIRDIARDYRVFFEKNISLDDESRFQDQWYHHLFSAYYSGDFREIISNIKTDSLFQRLLPANKKSDDGFKTGARFELKTYLALWHFVHTDDLNYGLIPKLLNNNQDGSSTMQVVTARFVERHIQEILLDKANKEIMADKKKPDIFINSVVSSEEIFEDYYELEGIATDNVDIQSLTVNGKKVSLRNNGFKRSVRLNPGKNTITIIVKDLAGNTTTKTIAIKKATRKDRAVFFATDQYDDKATWARLANPINDATTLATILHQKYHFDTTIIKNASVDDIYDFFEKSNKQEMHPDDQLLVYFTGHGLKNGELGYIVTKDSKARKLRTYFPYSELNQLLSTNKCQHIYLMIDVCHGGNFFNVTPSKSGNFDFDEPTTIKKREKIKRLLKFKTRKAISASDLEQVSDGDEHSPFASALIQFFQSNTKPISTTEDIYRAVVNLEPTPKQGSFKGDGNGSNFIFLKR